MPVMAYVKRPTSLSRTCRSLIRSVGAVREMTAGGGTGLGVVVVGGMVVVGAGGVVVGVVVVGDGPVVVGSVVTVPVAVVVSATVVVSVDVPSAVTPAEVLVTGGVGVPVRSSARAAGVIAVRATSTSPAVTPPTAFLSMRIVLMVFPCVRPHGGG